MKPQHSHPLRLIASYWLQAAAGCTEQVGIAGAHTFGILAAMARPKPQRPLPAWLREMREVREE